MLLVVATAIFGLLIGRKAGHTVIPIDDRVGGDSNNALALS